MNVPQLMNKVPSVTLTFWIIKIMATTVGETAADYLSFNLHMGIIVTTLIMSGLLLASLTAQLYTKIYIPIIYWISVVFISVVGTLITDNLTDNLGVDLITTSIAFSIALALTFSLWYWFERTLSIHTIYTKRREIFYWAAILFTFALGTAAGDLFAEKMDLGYAVSALIFLAAIAAIAIAYRVFRVQPVLAFWAAYILTRPFGASCGDYLSQSIKDGGLGLGTTATSAAFLIIIAGLIGYMSIVEKNKRLPQ